MATVVDKISGGVRRISQPARLKREDLISNSAKQEKPTLDPLGKDTPPRLTRLTRMFTISRDRCLTSATCNYLASSIQSNYAFRG
jgi:hypothetical protein